MDLASIPARTGPRRILALSGSLRAASTNTLLLQAAAALAPEGMVVRLFQGIGDLPHFNPDRDTDELRPAVVRRLRAAIAAADALLLSSPEYAHGVPGSLKNALDWLVSGPEFPAILVGLLSPSPHGTHAAAALRETLTTMSAELLPSVSVTVSAPRRPLGLPDILADEAVTTPLRIALDTLAMEVDRARRESRRLVPSGASEES